MDQEVIVRGRRCEVRVRQQSKSVWIATGVFFGVLIETKGASEGAALKRWREAAQFRGL
jgi:hypothetical protein